MIIKTNKAALYLAKKHFEREHERQERVEVFVEAMAYLVPIVAALVLIAAMVGL
jgi:hypothetical protein